METGKLKIKKIYKLRAMKTYGLNVKKTYGLKGRRAYKDIFENNTEAALVNAVKKGLNVYHRIYYSKHDNDMYKTFFEAAVRYGTPAVVHACIDMGADVNCVSPIKAKYTSARMMTSSLCAAMYAYNPATLRALLERGARIGVLNNLRWSVQRNLFPEAGDDEEARAIKRRLDAGAEILEILRDADFTPPGLEGTEGLSFYHIRGGGCTDLDSEYAEMEERSGERYTAWEDWDGEYADGGDSFRGWDELEMHSSQLYPGDSFPMPGARPGALWHAVSPEALRLMIEAGADVNMRDAAGFTTMHYIAGHHESDYYYKPLDMLRLLIERGAEIDARSGCGVTPLMLAAVNHGLTYDWDVDIYNFLLERGADFRALDNRGCDVWDWATYYWFPHEYEDLDCFIHQRVLLELCRFVLPDKGEEGEENFGITLMEDRFGGAGEALAFLIANGLYPGLARLRRSREDERRMADELRRWGLKPFRRFRDVFAGNGADAVADAVRGGMDLTLWDTAGENCCGAAIHHGAPEVVQACADRGMGEKELGDGLLDATLARNAEAVAILLKAGADPTGASKLPWYLRANVFPEGEEGAAVTAKAKAFKKGLDDGARILRLLREAGVDLPSADGPELTYAGIGEERYVSAGARFLKKGFMGRCDRHREPFAGSEATDPAAVGVLGRAASPGALRPLVESGINVNARDEEGKTAMHWIADDWDGYYDAAGMIEILIEAGADVNACDGEGLTPLSLAALNAVSHPHAQEAYRPLLSAGANLEDGSGHSVFDWLNSRIIGLSKEDSLRRDLFRLIREAFAPEAAPDADGSTRKKAEVDLMTAAFWESPAEIEAALSRGADVNARTRDGYTPLMYASAFNTTEAVRLLMARGADVNAKTFDDRESDARLTALLFAARRRKWGRDGSASEVVRALTEAGADVSARDRHGMTPLLYTAQAVWTDETVAAASLLIETGAEVDAKDDYGITALEWAIERNHLETAAVLLAAGADPRDIFREA